MEANRGYCNRTMEPSNLHLPDVMNRSQDYRVGTLDCLVVEAAGVHSRAVEALKADMPQGVQYMTLAVR